MTKIISENNSGCTVNVFIFACFFFFFFFFFVVVFFCQNNLIVTSDVIICTGYTIFANTLNLWVYIFRNNSKKKMLCKSKGTCCMFIGVKNQQSKSCPPCMLHTFLTWYMSLPKIIKLSQTVWEIWHAQDFGIRGDKYIMEKVRVHLNTTCLLVLIYALPNINKIFQTTYSRIWLRNSFEEGN